MISDLLIRTSEQGGAADDNRRWRTAQYQARVHRRYQQKNISSLVAAPAVPAKETNKNQGNEMLD
jgi:hypothetical protein